MLFELAFICGIFGTLFLVVMMSRSESNKAKVNNVKDIKAWTAPTYEANQVSTLSANQPVNDSLYPDLSAIPAVSQRLNEVYLTYLIWDRKIIGKPHPEFEVALQYGSDWHTSRIDETKERILSALKSNPTEKLGSLWGTRHHAFAYAIRELTFKEMTWGVGSDEFEDELHRLTFGVLNSQYVTCRVDVRSFDAQQWDLLFTQNKVFSSLEDFMTIPASSKWSCVEDIRTYVSNVRPNDFLVNF